MANIGVVTNWLNFGTQVIDLLEAMLGKGAGGSTGSAAHTAAVAKLKQIKATHAELAKQLMDMTPVRTTVQALDSKSIMDRSSDIAAAVLKELRSGGALAQQLLEMKGADSDKPGAPPKGENPPDKAPQ
jgi:hypothetical protein